MQQSDKVWAVNLPEADGGGTFQVRDLPATMIAEIAAANGTAWQVVVDAPLSIVGVALDVLKQVAIVADVTFPDMRRATGRDFISTVIALFDLVDDEPAQLETIHYVAPSA